jgi:hypothetical protein
MGIRIRVLPIAFLLIGTIWFVPSVCAASPTAVQCAANDDRVWVYDSLTSFSVEMKLNCGEQVEIIGRAKGYVKIRTQAGKEGYVPEASFPGLQPYVDPNDTPKDEGLATVLRARRLEAKNAAQPAARVVTATPVSSSAPESTVSIEVSEPAPVAVKPVDRPTVALSTSPAPVSAPSESPAATPSAPPPIVAARTPVATVNRPAVSVKPVSVAPKKTRPAAPRPSAPAIESRSTATSVASAQPPVSASRSQTRLTAERSNAQKDADRSSIQVVSLSTASDAQPARIEAVSDTKPASSALDSRETGATASLRTAADSSDSEDYPEDQPEDQSADPNCRTYFSAYGLAPSQAQWIEQTRKKKYPSICPAASPAKVDFVVIFTHDVEIYNSTLPDAVHVDQNGFSDFDPISPVDTAMMSQAAADKAHHQFVWVFRFKRGTFDPARFSPRRRPQFSKSEVNSLTASHAADRSVEDAFEYIQEQGQSGAR